MIISIIGGGATGAAVLIALIREIKRAKVAEKITINIFEPHQLGRGLAYANIDDCFLLNTSVCSTSLIASDYLDFFKWLKKNEKIWKKRYPKIKKYNQDSFLPRSLVGLYIECAIKSEINSLKREERVALHVNHIKERVINLDFKPKKQFIVIRTQKTTYFSKFCILCTGYSNGLPQAYQDLMQSSHYYPSPYLYAKKIKKIPRNKKILIIGTRLSAVDAAALLRNHHHVVMASRYGYLPAVRNCLRFMPAQYLTVEHQAKFFNKHKYNLSVRLIKKEIEKELSLLSGQYIHLDKIKIRDSALQQLREDIYLAEKKLNRWEDSIMTFIIFIGNAWLLLSLHEKKELLANEINIINRYISAFPYVNAKILFGLIKKRKLSLRRGIKHIYLENNHFRAVFSHNHHEHEEIYDYVINATSVEKNIRHSGEEFYNKLNQNNIIKYNHFNGIQVTEFFQIENNYNKQFYAAGPIIKGSALITNFLLSSAQQAEVIAKSICKEMSIKAENEHEDSFLYIKKTAR